MDIATAVDKSAASGDGDYDGVCELLHSHMLESAHVRSSMLCVFCYLFTCDIMLQLQNKPTGDQDRSAGDQDRPASDQDRPAGDQDRPAGDRERSTGDQERPAGDQDRSTGNRDRSADDQDTLPAQDRPSSATQVTSPVPQGQIGKVDTMSYTACSDMHSPSAYHNSEGANYCWKIISQRKLTPRNYAHVM